MDKNRIKKFIIEYMDAVNKLFEDDLDAIKYVLGIACESLSLSEFVSFINKIDSIKNTFKEEYLDDNLLEFIDAILERIVSRTWDCDNFFKWISYRMNEVSNSISKSHSVAESILTDLAENLNDLIEKDGNIVKSCEINYTILNSNNTEFKTESLENFVIIPKGVNANLLGNGAYQHQAIEDAVLTFVSKLYGTNKKYIRLNWIEWD